MGKRILFICASPRKNGNTQRVVSWVAGAVRAAGAECEIVDAARIDYRVNGCTACMACQKKEGFGCVIEDEASPVIARVAEFDVLALATPIYFFGPSAQLKLILDRMFSLFKFDTDPPKSVFDRMGLALVATGGGSLSDGLRQLDDTYAAMARSLEIPYTSLLVPNTPHETEEIEQREALKEEAVAFGRRLASGDF